MNPRFHIWQPTATIPRDGTEIVGSLPGGLYVMWWYDDDGCWMIEFDPLPSGVEPEFWLPIPPRPLVEDVPQSTDGGWVSARVLARRLAELED